MEKPKTFIFVGRSGCGKGTQAKLVIEKIKAESQIPVLYYEGGEHFRSFVKGSSFSVQLAKAIAGVGGLQPSFLAVRMWSNLLVENATGAEHLVLDGSPRTLMEAEVLDTAIKFYQRQEPTVIYIDIPREESKRRLELRGREDDKELSDIENRLNWFDRDVLPALEWYRNNPSYKFVQIDGVGTIEEVQKRVLVAL